MTQSLRQLSLLPLFFVIIICRLGPADAVSAAAAKPLITLPPMDTAALPMSPLSLTCVATGDPKPRIAWYNGSGHPVSSLSEDPIRSLIHLDSAGKLTFLSFNAKFEGQYYCNASNEGGWTVSEPVWARLAYLRRKFRSDPQSKSVPTDSTIEIECDPPEGMPKPEVTWRKNGLRLDTDGRRLVVMDSGHLRISRAGLNDAGEYACVATNLAGQHLSGSAIIAVKSKPAFHLAPMDLTVLQGENATFNCTARGEPAPTLNWKKDNGQIAKSRSVSHSNGSLTIWRVASADAGKYVCEASNSAGTNEAVASLTVYAKPEFIETPADQAATEGDRVVFACRVVGHPKPNTFWSKGKGQFIFADSKQDLLTDDLRGIQVGADGSLTIERVRKHHEGEYECHATAFTGSVQSSARLSVTARALMAPIIAFGPQSQAVPRGQDLQLNCRVDADYLGANAQFRPQIRWYKNAELIGLPTNRFHLNLDGSLRVYDVQPSDRGNYTCSIAMGGKVTAWPVPAVVDVTNHPAAHDASASAGRPLDVSELPRPPSAVAVTDKGVSWVLLKLTPPLLQQPPQSPLGETPRYQVEYLSHDLATGWQVFPRLFESETVKVEGLRSEASYQFLVRTVTSRGASKPSVLSPVVRTDPKTPEDQFRYSDIPRYLQKIHYTGVRLEVIEKSVVRVLWRVQANKNTLELTHGFHVNYKIVPLRRCIDLAQLSEQDRRSHCSLANEQQLIGHLRSRLAADGDGPSSSAASSSSSSAGQNPAAAAASAGGDPLSLAEGGYADHKVATLRWRYSEDVREEEMSKTLDNLIPFSCYEVTVENFNTQAMYGETRGSRSIPHTVLTWEYFPTKPPSSIRAHWLTNTSLMVSWKPPPPADSNGILTGFNIHLLLLLLPTQQPSAQSGGNVSQRWQRAR